MKINLLGPLVVLILSSIIISGQSPYGARNYVPFNFGLTWEEAQHFCRSYYTDLATISTQSDVDSIDLKQYWMWVGLHRHWYQWRWHYSQHWAKNEPQEGSCAAVDFRDKKFYSKDCTLRLMFVCYGHDYYLFVKEAKSWNDAWNYCKEHHKDLAKFGWSNINDILSEMDFPVWVGKHIQEESDGKCDSIFSLSKTMTSEYCNVPLPFVCMSEGNPNVFVVKENKTWEEALEHCRGLKNDSIHFDLVSAKPGDEYEYMMTKVMEADTDEVWIGLRFLGDEWLWVNGADVSNTTLPQCPMWEQRCGALSKNNTGSVETRECSERKNFLCYSFSP